ncbi:MAG: hypothetical protein ACR2JU_15990 [Nocardioidaceae bacterium]
MRRLAILVLLMLALLPLRWFAVVSTPVGTLFLHELGLLLFSVLAVVTLTPRALAVAVGSTGFLTAAMAAGFAVWSAACLFHAVSPGSAIKQWAYLGSFVLVVAAVVCFAESKDPSAIRILRWVGVTTTLMLLAALELALRINHVDALHVLSTAVTSGDPSAIEAQLFRPAFVGFGYSEADTVSQLRHEVVAGLLVSLFVASWAQHRVPFARRSARWLSQSAVVVASLLIVLSLSRSVQIAAISWPLLAGLRVVLVGRVTRRQLVTAAIGAVVVVGVSASGFIGVILQRITQDSSSYNERGAKLSAAVDTIRQYPWSGGHYDDTISSHNFVLDAWLRGGVAMAALMLAALLFVLWRLAANVAVLASAPVELVPVTAAFMLPLVRMFTIGAGLMTPPEWVCLAFALAATTVYLREVRRRGRAVQSHPTDLSAGSRALVPR